jgi:DNA processing protein
MKWSKYPITKITLEHKNYPKILKKIKKPPPILYCRGPLNNNIFTKSLAVVGSRRITHYGRMAAEKIIPALAADKVTIISGFMYGVDSEAHRICLENGGLTVAVLGGGLDVIYPPENEKLYEQILKCDGAIVSEYPPDFKPQLWTFPQRNRIVAGLSCLGVLIIEAGEKSGSLITARFAREQGKKIFAVPGPITSSVSIGTNYLLQNHQAKMVLGAEDILGKKMEKLTLFSTANLTPLEKKIVQLLEAEPLTADEIGVKTEQKAIEVNQTLSLLSLKGLILEFAGKYCLNA